MEDLTIGIEEEYQIIDPETRELTSFVTEMLDQGAVLFRDQVKPEFMQSQIEIGSLVCRNIREARQEVIRLRSIVGEIAHKGNRKIVAAGTHPFSRWQDQMVTDKDRYRGLVDDMQMVAKRLLIFGMHVHIGIPDPNLRIDIMNQMTYFVPHIFALSTSSPFWDGEDTGLKSYRSVIFEDLPRTGLPEYFNSYSGYERYVKTLIKTNCIQEPTKIWWDIRPHPKFPTVEFRMCDCVTKVDEVIAIAALLQAMVAKLIKLRRNNQTWRIYRRGLIAENKWRAVKDGIEGKLIDFGEKKEVPVRFLMEEILDIVDDVVDELGTREEINYIRTIIKEGSSADRQIRKYNETKDLKAVVDMLADETILGC
ncbi:carboxylate-amine ligase [Anaerolineales bacterium HSG6]|nr:carboxylate-amine ligase [Anaerolineales bacterium HSG6]MDM8531776.1 carboxylate-amine ligase [Anaerolineales bacterium HSG25]